MLAHNAHLNGRLREGEFLDLRVDPILEDFFDWRKRKVFCDTDSIAAITRLVGVDVDVNIKPKKIKKTREVATIIWPSHRQLTFDDLWRNPTTDDHTLTNAYPTLSSAKSTNSYKRSTAYTRRSSC
jgi:hypothetical protein